MERNVSPRRIRRSEAVTCQSRSSPFVFATRRTVHRADDGRRDRRRTIVRRRRSNPSPSCINSPKLRQGHRRSTRPGVMCRGPAGCTGTPAANRRRRIGTRSKHRGASQVLTAPPTSVERQVHRALFEPGNRARCLGPRSLNDEGGHTSSMVVVAAAAAMSLNSFGVC